MVAFIFFFCFEISRTNCAANLSVSLIFLEVKIAIALFYTGKNLLPTTDNTRPDEAQKQGYKPCFVVGRWLFVVSYLITRVPPSLFSPSLLMFHSCRFFSSFLFWYLSTRWSMAITMRMIIRIMRSQPARELG